MTTILTKINDLREANPGSEWWKKLPRRNKKLPDEINSIYKMVDAFKESQAEKKQQIEELEKRLRNSENSS